MDADIVLEIDKGVYVIGDFTYMKPFAARILTEEILHQVGKKLRFNNWKGREENEINAV